MPRDPIVVDLRGRLPVHPTKRWGRRSRSDIRGVVFHHAAGRGTVEGVARYHSTPSPNNHLSRTGAPGISYVFYVDFEGTVYQCNDYEDVTWSQSGSPPLPLTKGNTNYLSVVFQGDFSTAGVHSGHDRLSPGQVAAAQQLWFMLKRELGLPEDMLFGHFEFGKEACPGDDLRKVMLDLTSGGLLIKPNIPRNILDWQRGLVRLKYDLGPWGPDGDGVDGQWGLASQSALESFGHGNFDADAAVHLATELAKLPPPVRCPEETPRVKPAKKTKRVRRTRDS